MRVSGLAPRARLRRRLNLYGLALVLAAPVQALAGESGGQPPGFWTSVLERLDIKSKPATMPDFVRSSRPDASRLTFRPTGPVPRDQAVPVKSAEEIEAAKTALDAAQAAQLRPRTAPARKTKPAEAKSP